MKSIPGTQLDLLGKPVLKAKEYHTRPWLVIEMDHRTWMRFLSEEWLFPGDSGRILLGLGTACSGSVAPDLMTVSVWFDQTKLPPIRVMVWSGDDWASVLLENLAPADTVISWDGPLPLFAVEHFTVDTNEAKAHLLALVRNFADIEFPSQPIEVGVVNKIVVPESRALPAGTKRPPGNWDALRGAASMAIWAVPAMGPWLQVLCGSLSSKKPNEFVKDVHTPWLRSALWSAKGQSSERLPPLWRAMIGEFSRPGALKEWKPRLLLDAVCSRARSLGDDENRLACLIESTTMLLLDRGTIQELGVKDDLLGLVLQLVLLRPSPERFATWKEDWPAIPPGAWWTGSILAGYLSGFRALPLRMRGSVEARRFLALRTWEFSGGKGGAEWNALWPGLLDWAVENDSIVLRVGHELLAGHKFSNRGRWCQVDLNNPAFREEAKVLAQQFCPDRLLQTLVLEDSDFKLLGNGRAKLDAKRMMLSVKGRLEIAIGSNASIASQLDEDGFRDWLATASIPHRLPRPPSPNDAERIISTSVHKLASESMSVAKKRATLKGTSTRAHMSPVDPPEGLQVVPDFISQAEEATLLEIIDALPWDATMSRRVQHYGWRYDYKARQVDPTAYIGPLPTWAKSLGERLLDHGFLFEQPDQVIVNEYVGQQGIAKHIDCPSCFRGAIVTISLNESWEMVFSRKDKSGDDQKYNVLLARRSAAVLDGAARSDWWHEIPRRRMEAGAARGRRVSVTFRKVDTKR